MGPQKILRADAGTRRYRPSAAARIFCERMQALVGTNGGIRAFALSLEPMGAQKILQAVEGTRRYQPSAAARIFL
jgi:hypothetical protein